MEYPKLKYVKDSKGFFDYSKEGVVCKCCGNNTHFYAFSIYSTEDIDVICYDCVVSGNACKKFNGTFNEVSKLIDNKEAMNEIIKKPPTIPAYQEIGWPTCCNDMCIYLGVCSKEDLENEQIWNDIEETYDEDDAKYIPLEELKEMNPSYLLLFKCPVCNKHRIVVDLD